MNRKKLFLLSVLAGSVAFGGRASAQDVTPQPAPAYISAIDGTATLVRDGQAEAASSNLPLLEGDRLSTAAGRIEVFLPDGSLLHLDHNTTVDLLSDSLTRLIGGRVIVVVAGRSDEPPSADYQIDAAAGSVRILRPGEYRVSLVPGRPGPDVELAVVRGHATLTSNRGSVGVGAGQFSTAADDYAPADPESFNSARLDAFARWSSDRLDAHLGYASRQYLPSEVQVYSSTFDRYGTWEDVQPYGYVWYPTVAVGWRPYYDGYWRTVGPYGWTWIGYDPWCWPTHHYGRWGVGARGWFWIPGRSWGAAWVSWGIGSSYVGWCPLGWNNYAVVDLSFGVRWGSGLRHDPWSAWTVVPRGHFGARGRVPVVAVRGEGLRAVERSGLAVRREGPPSGGRTTARPFGVSAVNGQAMGQGGRAAAGGASGRPVAVSRTGPGAAGSPPASGRPLGAVSRTAPSAASGMPPRDAGPAAAVRPQPRPSASTAGAASRPASSPVRTYERTQGIASAREVRAPGSMGTVERRSPESLAEVAARTNAARRSPDPAQRDAGSRVYSTAPQAYRRPSPQGVEPGDRAQPTEPLSAQPRALGSRAVPAAPASERRMPGAAATPRAPDRPQAAGPRQLQPPPAVERWMPEAVAAPRAPDRSLTAGPRPLQQAPAVERRAPERAAPPQMSQPSRPERAAPTSRSAAPAQPSAPSARQAPQRTAPSGGPARGGASGGIRRR